jgi:hypothetical protein
MALDWDMACAQTTIVPFKEPSTSLMTRVLYCTVDPSYMTCYGMFFKLVTVLKKSLYGTLEEHRVDVLCILGLA